MAPARHVDPLRARRRSRHGRRQLREGVDDLGPQQHMRRRQRRDHRPAQPVAQRGMVEDQRTAGAGRLEDAVDPGIAVAEQRRVRHLRCGQQQFRQETEDPRAEIRWLVRRDDEHLLVDVDLVGIALAEKGAIDVLGRPVRELAVEAVARLVVLVDQRVVREEQAAGLVQTVSVQANVGAAEQAEARNGERLAVQSEPVEFRTRKRHVAAQIVHLDSGKQRLLVDRGKLGRLEKRDRCHPVQRRGARCGLFDVQRARSPKWMACGATPSVAAGTMWPCYQPSGRREAGRAAVIASTIPVNQNPATLCGT